MKFRWSTAAEPSPACHDVLVGEVKVSSLLARCLINRGFQDPALAERFLRPRLSHLADPFLLPNMDRAVGRLFQALHATKPLVIFGDYDVDGVTSTALLTEALTHLGWCVDHYIPHRLEEGYGLTPVAAENCLARFPYSLLVAVDCGSTAVEVIGALRARGVDVIVLDHHQVSGSLPPAVALVNPHLAKEGEPCFRELCSVGLAFKLVHALVKRGRDEGMPVAQTFDLRPLLDLVALGTIADVVPLRAENRIFVNCGLERLRATNRPGLVALKKVAQVREPLGGYEVGFQLAPRLNAAGRLQDAQQALELLLARAPEQAEELALQLDGHNRERQGIERNIVNQVIGAVRATFDPARDYVIVEGQLLWHLGVVGIVASRVVQEFHRPTIILAGEATEWRGSGRSIEGFDLAAALRECDSLLIRHGGHAMAAGLTILPNNVAPFRQALNEWARKNLSAEQLVPRLRLDGEVTLADMKLDRIQELASLQQTGTDNPPVQVWARGLRLGRPPEQMGKNKQHAKWRVTDGNHTCEAVWWGQGDAPIPQGAFDLAFRPELNEFNGSCSVRLRALDWRPCDPGRSHSKGPRSEVIETGVVGDA